VLALAGPAGVGASVGVGEVMIVGDVVMVGPGNTVSVVVPPQGLEIAGPQSPQGFA
jgi:hypothetical protein